MDDFGLLVGRYYTSLPSLSNTQLSELQLDSSGRLIIAGRFLEDSAHSSGDSGLSMLAVRNDSEGSLVDTDGDYAPLQVDSLGRLRVVADLSIATSSEKTEDSAHVSLDIGNYVLAVRADARPTDSNTSADGDYSSFFVNDSGELYVKDTDVLAQLVTIDSVLDSIAVDTGNIATSVSNIETDTGNIATSNSNIEADTGNIATSVASIDSELQSITHAEDALHVSGDSGVMSLAVRKDADGPFGGDGDYSPLQLNSSGFLKVSGNLSVSAPGSEQYTVSDALAAAGDGLVTITATATPWVTVASLAVGAGQNAYLYAYQWACDQNAQMRIVTDDTSDIIIYKTSINSSAHPGTHESWSESGRIEIPGAANLEVKLQIKKRSATGGDANGTGSMHLRVI